MKKYIRPEAEYIEFYSDVEVAYTDASAQKDVDFGIVEDESGSWDQ